MDSSLSIPGNKFGVIRHPKLPLVILRTDYLSLAKGNHCAAKLLAVLENWTNWFVRQGKPERWVRLTTEAISKHLLGEHKKVAIQKALALLVNLGFVRQEQRRKHRYDLGFFYWLDIERVQEAIDALQLPNEPDTEENYLRMGAVLEPETLVVVDPLSTAHQQFQKDTNDWLSTAYRDAVNSQSICHSTAHRDAVNSQSLNRDLNKNQISSSISAHTEKSGEEELEILKKTEEATQSDAIRSEGTSKPETVIESEGTSKPEVASKPEGISTSELPASLIDKSENVPQPKDLDGPVCSGASRENENQSHTTEDAALLKWLVEVKIPKMELDDPPRNLLAYAKAMIKRDGDTLRAEFADVLGDRRFREECMTLTEKVEARVEEWRQAGHRPSIFFDFDGRPQVRLDLTTISAADFLAKPIEQLPLTDPATSVNFLEQAQTRKVRQSRLKAVAALGESPGFEFLAECRGDVMLRSQVKALIAKHPHWGIFVDSADQLQSWFD